MNIFKIALLFEKGNKGLFDVPIQKQYAYMNSLGEPKDDIDRSYKQFLCQNYFVPFWKKCVWWIVSLLATPIAVLVLFVKGRSIHFVEKIDTIAENKGMDEIIPAALYEKYEINHKYWNAGFGLSVNDIKYIVKHILGWRQPYFVFKTVLLIAKYSSKVAKYQPKRLIEHSEFSFCSSVITDYCHSRDVKHINVQHGEKLRYIRDSFFHYDECYVWDEHYVNLFKEMHAEPSQFKVAVPPSLRIDCKAYHNPLVYADYKYYLAADTEEDIKSIVASMAFAKREGKIVKYRTHPRYTDLNVLRKYVGDDEIELPKDVSILESISNMEYAVGSFTTVLLQAYLSGKKVLLDDVTYKMRFEQLKEYGYILAKDSIERLSERQKLNIIQCSIKYDVDAKPLGIGGAAKVYGCTRIDDGERLAIKILSDKNDKGKVERFRREIDAIIDIVNHGIDGVLPILDYDKEDLWYVMPLANSLSRIIDNYTKLQRTTIPVTTYRDEILQQNVEGFIMLAATLEKIHALGYVHRDIKPDNLYVWNGRYCIGDFGIVDLPTNTALTKKHDRLGAWNTIAPEVLRDARIATNKSDVYSLAKSLWMCLSLNTSGFDGRYDYNASSMSLHDMPHLVNAYLLDIDELLYDATQEDPVLRPSMQDFANRLYEWQRTSTDFEKENKKEWGFIYKALFRGFAMPVVSISDTRDIVRILHLFARYTHLNYTMTPQEGGLTLKGANISPEKGCVYLDLGCTFVCKPSQLVLRGFNNDESWNYIFLELEELKPILTNGVDEEELVEDTPAHYVDSTYAVYGVYDYDSGKKFPSGWKQVARVCKGNFLIVSKAGFYNSITPTDDGRQSDFSETEFFDYITTMKKDVDDAKSNGTNLSYVRRKYWANPKQILLVSKEENEQTSDFDIGEHLDELNFVDLIDGTGDGYAKYYFTFETPTFRSPFDFYKDFYLCKDGAIKELDNNDDNIYFAYDMDKALSLLEQLNQRIAEVCKGHGVADSCQRVWVKVHCVMQKMPTHLFTYKELDKAILAADDRKDNVICIDAEGHVVVACGVDYHIYPVSYERFGAFKNCVGPYSNGTAEYIVKDLRSLFLQYIKTGKEARYTEDSVNRNIKDIIRETKALLNGYKNG